MNKKEVILLSRDLFKIRISSSREGLAQDDGVHRMKVNGITSYDDEAIAKWYLEAIKTAEIIIALEDQYIDNTNQNQVLAGN
jgi:hypothetical protein